MWASKICSGLQQKTACIAKNTVPDLFQILVEDLSPDKNKSLRFHTRDFLYIFILEIFSLTKKTHLQLPCSIRVRQYFAEM